MCGLNKRDIDIAFDFTADTPGYWEGFWTRNNGLGAGGNDPDAKSKVLQRYHQILWSRLTPSGKKIELVVDDGANYLSWGVFRFGSDSITASFRYNACKAVLQEVEKAVPNYEMFVEGYLREFYTIGGMIIFPKRKGGINQSRGCNSLIRDRWDLTLECIRRYYLGESSPLYDVLLGEKAFFDLFLDFKGFVDFFFLQDCVSPDYSSVKIWLGDGDFMTNPLPQTVDEYFAWLDCNLNFVRNRNQRISEYCSR